MLQRGRILYRTHFMFSFAHASWNPSFDVSPFHRCIIGSYFRTDATILFHESYPSFEIVVNPRLSIHLNFRYGYRELTNSWYCHASCMPSLYFFLCRRIKFPLCLFKIYVQHINAASIVANHCRHLAYTYEWGDKLSCFRLNAWHKTFRL